MRAVLLGAGALLLGGFALMAKGDSNIDRVKGAKWDNTHPALRARVLELIAAVNRRTDVRQRGVTLHAFDAWRDLHDQQREIAEGDSFLSDALNGYHVWGLAVDLVWQDSNGNWTWLPTADNEPDPLWYALGEQAERLGLEWGGRWPGRQFDGPHVQLPVQRVAELKQAYATPAQFIQEWKAAGSVA